MFGSEVDFKNLWTFLQVNAPVFFSAYSHVFCAIYNAIPFLAVKNTKTENPTRAISKVIYISLGVTSAFLILSVAILVWCYRRKKLKTIERFVYLLIC